jgi:murein DD-endopeptidase MepM/ murein hydrolase activator NlpD
MLGCEATRLLFSRFGRKDAVFNAFERLKLSGQARLAVWDAKSGILGGPVGRFPVRQASWTREKYGNWLHRTSYGFHSAIDIYATNHGVPEEVLAPLDGKVYRVYNKDVPPDDEKNSKAVNIYSSAVVGPNGERILFRLQHFSEIFVSHGETVRAGQVIGLTGHTGFSSRIGDHLHFEIRLNPSHFGLSADSDLFQSVPVNPYPFLLEWYSEPEEAPVQRRDDGRPQ